MTFEFRTLKQNGYCRTCKRAINKDTDKVVYFEMVRGATGVLCQECVSEMFGAVISHQMEIKQGIARP